jgi:hypothetical protein
MRSVGLTLLALAVVGGCVPGGSREAALEGEPDPVLDGGSDDVASGGGKGGAHAGGAAGIDAGGSGGQAGDPGGEGGGQGGGSEPDAAAEPDSNVIPGEDAAPEDMALPIDRFVPPDLGVDRAPDLALPRDAPPPPPDAPPALHALMIVGEGKTPLTGTDLAIHTRVAAKLTVDILTENNASAASAKGKALVVITATASMTGTSTKFRDVTVPVLLFEPNLLGLMQMTDTSSSDHEATDDDEAQITILDPTSPLAAGFSGNVTVHNPAAKLVWGVPGPGGIKVASVVGAPSRVVIFAYPTGATMVGKTAPAKRISFFIHDTTSSSPVNANGLKLLDAAIAWAIE